MFSNSPVAKLRIRESSSTRMFNVYGVNSQTEDETTAATQTNKLFAIAGLSVTGDEQTTLTIEKVVIDNG